MQRGPGRPPGSPNKLTADIRKAIAAAFDKVGGVDYLVKQANENPQAFMTLLGKALPKELTGEGGGAISIRVVTGVPRAE